MNFNKPLYYLVLIPISLLPFFMLHGISRILFFTIYYLIGYRKKVVSENIYNSFPQKNEMERILLAKKFYKQLCDVILESIKIFTISKKQLAKHINCINPEVINKYFEQGKNVIIAVGHCNSWELMLTGIDSFIKHKAVVIYQPLSNQYLDKKLIEARSKQGTVMLPAKNVKSFYTMPSEHLHATVFAIDQAPSDPTKCYWMKFLNQDTPVLFGTERYAKEYDLPVLYARLNKLKRGYYTLEFVEVVVNAAATEYGEITERVTQLLEKDIIKHPEFWLWSHKRWKHKRTTTAS